MSDGATEGATSASDVSAIDPELGARVRQLAGEYGVVRNHIRAALVFLPDAAADVAEFATEQHVRNC